MLDLTVSVSADEWAYVQRRVLYLESLLIRVVREKMGIQEWFSAHELSNLDLPGLPPSRTGISHHAKKAGWRTTRVKDDGERNLYHVTSLPPRAFDALLSIIIGPGDLKAEIATLPDLPPPAKVPAVPKNTTPAWVLPLMRLVKGEANGDLSRAWRHLPAALPPGMAVPTVEEAAKVLVELGLFKA